MAKAARANGARLAEPWKALWDKMQRLGAEEGRALFYAFLAFTEAYVDVGRITVLFEDAVAVWLQIEETLFFEEELGDQLLNEAVATYLPIVPRRGEISLTVMVSLFNEEELGPCFLNSARYKTWYA